MTFVQKPQFFYCFLKSFSILTFISTDYKTKVSPNTRLKSRLLDKAKEESLHCSYCNYKFSLMHKKIKHLHRYHAEQNPFHCPKCDFKTRNTKSLYCHLRKHSEGKRYYCTECNYTTHYRTVLVRHLLVHNEENSPTRPIFTAHKACQTESS